MKFIDNIIDTVKSDMETTIVKDCRNSRAASYFSIFAFEALKKELQEIAEPRFIFTSPAFILKKTTKEKREFYIPRLGRERNLYGTEFEVKLRNEVSQRAIAELLDKYTNKGSVAKISGFGIDNYYSRRNGAIKIRRNKTFKWESFRNKPNDASQNAFEKYYKKIRPRVQYINGLNDYWFIKRTELKRNIDLNPMIITYAAMHRLSELARYQPNILTKHFDKSHSWLLSEFTQKSLSQFVDGIASEITGSDFRK